MRAPRLGLLLAAVVVASVTPATAHPPAVGPITVFASGIAGPEGVAFDRNGTLLVGEADGDIVRILADGSVHPFASTGEPLAGITVLRDGRTLAASFGSGNVWSVPRGGGSATVLANVPGGPNFIVESRSGKIFVSASTAGTIVEISTGTPITVASGLAYPNGMAIGPDRDLYVAELALGRVVRLPLSRDGTLGPPEVYGTGVQLADGIAFDRRGNLLVVGFDTLSVIDRTTRATSVLSTDPLFEWPSNLAFGRGGGFPRKSVYLVNFGLPLGSGTTVLRMEYNHGGASLVR